MRRRSVAPSSPAFRLLVNITRTHSPVPLRHLAGTPPVVVVGGGVGRAFDSSPPPERLLMIAGVSGAVTSFKRLRHTPPPPRSSIVCLKWLSEVSLPFRPSSSARSHLTLSDDGARRGTPAPPLGVGRGPEGRAPLVKAEMKRAAVGIGWSRPASKRCRQGPSLELRWRATHQRSGAANSQRLKSSASLLPLLPLQQPSRSPASSLDLQLPRVTCHLIEEKKKKGLFVA